MKDKEFFTKFIKCFLEQNSKLNLISKNDEKFLWEKHIFDSLSIEKFFEKYPCNCKRLLDIGTGGGFPAVPIAIAYPNIQVYGLDSIRKKINAIEQVKINLNIENLHTICDRVENISIEQFDIITSRAVAPLSVITNYAMPHLKKGGYFIAYKSVKTQDEIEDAKKILKKYKANVIDVIEYKLPLEENFVRNLIVIQ